MEVIENIRYGFNRISIYLASNYPKAWSLGWLTQLTIALIIYPLTFLVAMLIPMDLTDTPSVQKWYGLGYIPAVFWSIFIIYRLVKYNSEKLFGNRNRIHNFIELPSYLIQFMMPLVIPSMLGIILTLRIGGLIDLKDLNQSKIAFEEAQPFFSIDYGGGNYMWRSYDYSYDNEYSRLHDMFVYYENDDDYYHSIVAKKADFYNNIQQYDDNGNLIKDAEYMRNAYLRDSVDQYNNNRNLLRDSIANHRGIFKDSRPLLYPLYFYYFDYYDGQHQSILFSSKEIIYNTDSLKQLYFYNNHRDENFVKGKLESYLSYLDYFGEDISSTFTADELFEMFNKHIYSASKDSDIAKKISALDRASSNFKNQIDYIQKCKDGNFYFMNDDTYFAIVFGFLFGLTLLFSVFKNLHWIEFLVGLFVVVVIPILLGIFMAIMRWDEDNIVLAFWLIFIGFIIWGVIEQRNSIRRKRGAILLIVLHLCLAYVPLAFLGTLDEVFNFWEWSYFDQYLIASPTDYDPERMDYNNEYYSIKRNALGNMMVLGYVTYLLVLYPLWIKPNWMKFSAKPKKS